MPVRVQPISHPKPTFFHEGSRLRSYRDEDMIGQQWRKNKEMSAQINVLTQAVKRLQDEINRLRIYKSGSGGSSDCPYG